MLALALALLVAACGGPSTMRVVNRTEVPVVVLTGGGSSLVVEACAERTVELEGGVWGGRGSGLRHDEEAPPGAYVLQPPGDALTPPIEGRNDRTVVVTRDYIGYTYMGSEPYPIAGSGSFPPDPAATECAGSPPPLPSPAASAAP